MRVLRLSRFAAAVLPAVSMAACGGSNGADVPNASTVREAATRLDTLAPQWMERTGVPGVAVSVVHGDRTVYAKGFGMRRADGSEAVDADTVFQFSSVSKSLSATVMAAQMSQQCALAWMRARSSSACCPVSRRPTQRHRTTPSQPLQHYNGRYANAYYGDARVERVKGGGVLELVIGSAPSRHRLRYHDGDVFAFDLQGENAPPGSVSAVRFDAGQMRIQYYAEDLAHGLFKRLVEDLWQRCYPFTTTPAIRKEFPTCTHLFHLA